MKIANCLKLSFLVLLIGCGTLDKDSPSITKLNRPTFSIESGTYIESQTILINSDENGSVILFNRDGNVNSTSEIYTEPIVLSESGTYNITAKVTKTGFEDSQISSVLVTIDLPINPLSRIEYRQPSGELMGQVDFTYDVDGKLITVEKEASEDYNLSYSSGKISAIERVDSSPFSGLYNVTYTNGLISAIGEPSQLNYSFEYNSNIKVELWRRENVYAVYTKYNYDNNRNVIEVIDYQDGGNTTTPDIILTYDTDINTILSDINLPQAVAIFLDLVPEEEILFSHNLPNYKIAEIEGEISYTFYEDNRIKEINDYQGDRILFFYE